MRHYWENWSIRHRILIALSLLLCLSHTASAVTIGPALTKKERQRAGSADASRDGGRLAQDKLMAAFLKDDHAQVDKITQPLLKRTHSHPEYDEMLYIRSLSLMKLGRIDEARSLLTQLESRASDPALKAKAAYSLGDSYFYTSGETSAYQSALDRYPFYEEADMIRTRIRERYALLTPPAAPSRPLQQMAVVEMPLYSVQVGSFSKEKNAKQLVSKLIRQRYDARVLPDDPKDMYRVRIGSFASRHDALILERKLKKEGYPTKIVP